MVPVDSAAQRSEPAPGPGSTVPGHVAIIMDGNGRWAQARDLPRIEGHRAGIESVREVVTAAREMGIRYLTLYAFSSENWKRPRSEVTALMRLLREFLVQETRTMIDNEIRLATIGNPRQLPLYVRQAVDRCRRKTAGGQQMQLTLALSYGSRDELVRGINRLRQEWKKTGVIPRAVSAEDLEAVLDTAGMPDPDLLVRTSGELRLSNFLLWQCAYSEFYFAEVPWPEFRRPHLTAAIEAFQNRHRRFGDIAAAADTQEQAGR